MRGRPVELPSLVHDFSHAEIREVLIGPRRETTLVVSPLIWEGCNARLAEPVFVRFGGIQNFAEVSAFFEARPHERSELAWLRYLDNRISKPGCLFFEMVFERIDARLEVQCSSMQVTSPVKQTPAEPDTAADRSNG